MEETPTAKGQLLVLVCPSKSKDFHIDPIGSDWCIHGAVNSFTWSCCVRCLLHKMVSIMQHSKKQQRPWVSNFSELMTADDCWCSWRTFASTRSLFGSSWRMSCTKWVPQRSRKRYCKDPLKESLTQRLGEQRRFQAAEGLQLRQLSTSRRCGRLRYPEAKELGNSAEVPFEGAFNLL